MAVDLGLEEENPSYRGRKLLWLTYDTEVGSYSVDPAERVLKRIRRIVIRRRWLHTVSKAQRSDTSFVVKREMLGNLPDNRALFPKSDL